MHADLRAGLHAQWCESFRESGEIAVGGLACGRDCECTWFRLPSRGEVGRSPVAMAREERKHAKAHPVGRGPVLRG